MKSKLQVRPVHQYRTPRYPAWSDPNPLDHPDALPFPFSQRVLSWILSSGLLATGGDILAQKSPSDTLYNPFPAANMGLPYTPTIFGTGLPERMKEKDIRAAIERGFKAEGITLQPNHVWHGKSGSALVDGYDSTSRIGYLFVSEARCGKNMIREEHFYQNDNPIRFNQPKKKGHSLAEYRNQFHQALKHKDIYQINALRYRSAKQDTFYVLLFNTFLSDLKAERPVREDVFYKILLYDHYLSSTSPYTKLVKKRVKTLIAIKNTTTFFKEMEAFCTLKDQRLLTQYCYEASALSHELDQLTAYTIPLFEKHPEKWAKHSEDYYFLLNEIYYLKDYGQSYTAQKDIAEGIRLFIKGNDLQKTREQLASMRHHDFAIDMDEFQEILAQTAAQEAFIIPITNNQPQTNLPDHQFSEKAEIPANIKDDLKKKQAWLQAEYEKRQQARTDNAMLRLENDVRMYIRWAKSQGRF